MTGDDDDRQIRIRPLDHGQHLEAVEPAALQPDVEDDEMRTPLLDGAQRLVAVAREARRVALVLENSRDEFADVGLVVDDRISAAISVPSYLLFDEAHAAGCAGVRSGRGWLPARLASSTGQVMRTRAPACALGPAARPRASARRRAAR